MGANRTVSPLRTVSPSSTASPSKTVSFARAFGATVVTGALSMLSFALPAHGQSSTDAAQRAFDEGMALMKAGRFEAACLKLEESQKIEAGMGTQFRLAQCYEKVGRVASAWKNYVAVAAAARAARLRTSDVTEGRNLEQRETYSQSRADALVPEVARASIQVPADVALLPDLTVTVDGGLIAPASWGSVPLDTGTHRVIAAAPGHEPFTTDVTVTENGARITIRIPPLEKAQILPVPAPKTEVVVVGPPASELEPITIAGVVLGSLGLVGMGVGVGLGFAAKAQHEDSAPFCNGDACRQEGLDIRADALTLGDVGTGVFIGGAVLGALGVSFIIVGLTMDDDEPLQASLSVAPLDAQLTVRW